jgi:hypothetical protein
VHRDIDASLAYTAETHYGHFASTHLKDIGVTRGERDQRLDSGRWVLVHDGVYRLAGAPPSWRGDLLAACWAGGQRAVASHRSAAALFDLPGSRTTPAEITCPRWRRTQHVGLVVHESSALSDRDITMIDQIPATTVERTLFDLAGVCRAFTVSLAIDNALRRKLTDMEELVRLFRRVGKRGRRGTRRFRGLLEERDASYVPTESERELMLVRVLREHGLPEAERQFAIYDQFGTFLARPDLVYRDLKIAMEYDSYQFHVGVRAHVRDNARRNSIASIGWIPLVATAEDVRFGNGARFVAEVRKARRTAELRQQTST